MNKMLIIVLILAVAVFTGCSEKNIEKEKRIEANDVYTFVIKKSIRECKEHSIILNEKRTNDFMRRSPKNTIEKTAKQKGKTPKKLCLFFADETSDKKIEKVNEFTSKMINGCKKFGVTLSKEKIHDKIENLPLFVIKKGLALGDETSIEECELMGKKYK
jgi:hypothetical protein